MRDDPSRWRERAEEARAVADAMVHLAPKLTLLRLAEEYERIAALTEASQASWRLHADAGMAA